ncbi:uncharacterized protein LOC144159865 [Haemaphysalis longicornis]
MPAYYLRIFVQSLLQGQVRHHEEQLPESRQSSELPQVHDTSLGDPRASSRGIRQQELQRLSEHAEVTELKAPAFAKWFLPFLLLLALGDARQHQGAKHLSTYQASGPDWGIVRRLLELGGPRADGNVCCWSETTEECLMWKNALVATRLTTCPEHYRLLTRLQAQEAGNEHLSVEPDACTRARRTLRCAACSDGGSADAASSGGLSSSGQGRRQRWVLLQMRSVYGLVKWQGPLVTWVALEGTT